MYNIELCTNYDSDFTVRSRPHTSGPSDSLTGNYVNTTSSNLIYCKA